MTRTRSGMPVAPPQDMVWIFTLISGAILWLLRDATLRLEGRPASPLSRALLWIAQRRRLAEYPASNN